MKKIPNYIASTFSLFLQIFCYIHFKIENQDLSDILKAIFLTMSIGLSMRLAVNIYFDELDERNKTTTK